MQQIPLNTHPIGVLRSEFESFEAADYEIRSHSTQQMRNIHTTTSNSGDLLVRRYYCESISTRSESTSRATRFYSDPKAKPKKGVETDQQKEQRDLRCNYFVAVKGLKGETVKLITENDRSKHTCQARNSVNERKRTHAIMSKSISRNPNLTFVGKSHNFRLNNAIIQNELTPRNLLNQSILLHRSSLLRAKKETTETLLGNHRKDVKFLLSAAKRCNKYGDRCQILHGLIGGENSYEGFLFAPRLSIKSEGYWRDHVYTDMTHIYNLIKGFLGAITTLNANDEMVILVMMHCQSENEANYKIMFKFFKECYPLLSGSRNLTVSSDGDKGIVPSLRHELPNARHVRCHYHLSRNISTNENDPGVIQFKRTAYAVSKEEFDIEMVRLKQFPKAYSVIEHLIPEQWAYHAVPSNVHGRLSSQVSEVLNSILNGYGVRLCSPLKMIEKLSRWSHEKSLLNMDRSKQILDDGEYCTPSSKLYLESITKRQPGSILNDEHVVVTDSRISATVSFPSSSEPIKFNVLMKLDSDNDIWDYSCTCSSRKDSACIHVIGLLQRLEVQSQFKVPDLFTLVHNDKTAMRFFDQYKCSIGELIDFDQLSEAELLPGSVSIRPGRPRSRRLVKRGTTNTCGYCGIFGHNKLTCPQLKQVCSVCGLRGHNVRTCSTPLDHYHRSAIGEEQMADAEKRRLERNIVNSSNSYQQRHQPSVSTGQQPASSSDLPVPQSAPEPGPSSQQEARDSSDLLLDVFGRDTDDDESGEELPSLSIFDSSIE